MAFYDQVWYANFGDGSTTGYYAITVRPQNTAVAAGVLRRQFTAPAVGSERCFICIVAGTTANTTDATWVLTRGAKTTDGTATWQECTGASAVNGDLTNTANWTTAKATGTPTLGAIIKRNNGASYQICSTAGTLGTSEPAFSDTAGVTTADGTTTWTSLGVVGNFTGGAAPHARLASACATNWFVANNTIYVGDNHAESQTTTITMAPAGSVATIGKMLCHNHSGSYPPATSDLTTGATVTTTSAVTIQFSASSSGTFYLYGLTLIVGVGQSGVASINFNTANSTIYFDACSLQLASTGSTSVITLGGTAAGNNIILNNTTVKFANTLQSVVPGNGQFIWQNTGAVLVSGSSIPSNLVLPSAGNCDNVVLQVLDLSQLTGNVIGIGPTGNQVGNWLVQDCRLNVSATFVTPNAPGLTIQFVRSDSGATSYKSARYAYEGTETTETSITRVGGATDPTGQAQSRKIVTTANSQWLRPFNAEPYAIWNSITAANVTVTVYGTINAGAVPNNDDIWLEVEYLGSPATPLGKIVTTTKVSVLAANAAVASDGSVWNGGGSGAGWSPFKLVATLSSPQPGLAGYIDVRVRAAKVSASFYVDPKIELT